ncbi:MAG: DNA helicase UvrD, partial [Gammaproteobacteria bacterium]
QNGWRKPRGVTKGQGFPVGTPERKQRKAEFVALLLELQEQPELLAALQELRTLPALEDHGENWDLVLTVSRLLPQLAAHLLLVFQARGQVDYTQVALSALDALGSADAPSELAMRLDYGISHILVDEFQDTAINQYRLIERLTADWLEYNQNNPDNPHTLMVVGDAMQSIYRFRNANVGLFLKARDKGFSGLKLTSLQLRCNFRSDSTVVDWVNKVFCDAFPQCDDIARSQVSYTQAASVNIGGAAKPVSTELFYGERAADEEVLSICDQIEKGIADASCRSIAVLGRSRKSLAPIMDELDARGIVYNAQEIAALGASPVVQGLTALFSAMANRADALAWISLLRAPWCGLRLEDLLQIARHRRALGNPSVWATLHDAELAALLSDEARLRVNALCNALSWGIAHRQRLAMRVWIEQLWLKLQGPACAVEPQQHSDAQQVLEIIETMEAAGEGLSVAALKRRLADAKISREVAGAKVQFMTLHKSKGLEFDWVFIPDL